MSEVDAARARFVYEAARLQALAVDAPVVPEPWEERDDAFRAQFVEVIERQMGPMRSSCPEELHGGWVQAYIDMGWTFGPVRDVDAKTHPDMVPFAELEQREQDKDAVFIALCEIARRWIRPEAPVASGERVPVCATCGDTKTVRRYLTEGSPLRALPCPDCVSNTDKEE